jgi:branched-chain amino acid transport system substrate-binding protein
MKRPKWLVICSMLLAFALIGAACGGDDDEGGSDAGGGGEKQDCTWEIGTLGALSGDLATIGGPIFKGIEYGVERANEDAGLPCTLELNSQDSQGSEDQAPALAQTLAQTEDLVGIIGPYFSGETQASGDTFDEAGIPFLTPSATNPDLSGNGWTGFFRLVGTDAQQGEEAATYLSDVAGAKAVVVMNDNSEYGKPLSDVVAETLGDAALTNIAINPEETDHSAEISKAKAADPDAIFFGGYQPEYSELLKQAADAGLNVQWASGDGSKAPELAEDPSAQGAVVFCPCDDPAVSTNPEANQFAKDFEADVGEPPGTYAVEGFDGVQALAAGLKAGGYDADSDIAEIRSGLVDWLHSNAYEGLSKTYEFDDTGEIGTVSIFAYQVEGDNFKQLGLVSELAK